MAGNQVVSLKEADGTTITDVEVLGTGRQAAANSKSVTFSSEDFAVLNDLETLIGSGNTLLTTLGTYLDNVEALITATNNAIAAATIPTVAHDAADSGDPLKIGGRARSSEIAPVVNNDRTDFLTDLVGKLITLPYANPENFVSGATAAITNTTSTPVVAAPGAGLRNYITQITVSNLHATAGTDVLIQNGNGGATLYVIPAAALYGGATITFPTPLKQTSTATALYCAATIAASIRVSASGYIGA